MKAFDREVEPQWGLKGPPRPCISLFCAETVGSQPPPFLPSHGPRRHNLRGEILDYVAGRDVPIATLSPPALLTWARPVSSDFPPMTRDDCCWGGHRTRLPVTSVSAPSPGQSHGHIPVHQPTTSPEQKQVRQCQFGRPGEGSPDPREQEGSFTKGHLSPSTLRRQWGQKAGGV